MRKYELTVIVQPNLEDEERVVLLDRVQEWVTAAEGQVIKVDHWGRRKLAYQIRKFKEGYYVMLTLQMPPAGVRELERRLQITEPIIRYLTVRLDE